MDYWDIEYCVGVVVNLNILDGKLFLRVIGFLKCFSFKMSF